MDPRGAGNYLSQREKDRLSGMKDRPNWDRQVRSTADKEGNPLNTNTVDLPADATVALAERDCLHIIDDVGSISKVTALSGGKTINDQPF